MNKKLPLAMSASLVVGIAAISHAAPTSDRDRPTVGMVASAEIQAVGRMPPVRVPGRLPEPFEIRGADAVPGPGQSCCGMPSDAMAY